MAVKPFVIGLAAASIAAAAGLYAYTRPAHPVPMDTSKTAITVGGSRILVDIADTDAKREQGLSGRTSLPEGEGLLFLFDTDGAWGIWMKDMRFSIDIVWADAEGTIITIARDVSPDTYPQVFVPDAPAHYILELPAGYTAKQGIAEGDKIVL